METASHHEDLNNKIAPVASEPPSSGFHLWRYGRGHFAMSPPIQNMKLRPFGEDYMFPAWMAWCDWVTLNVWGVEE